MLAEFFCADFWKFFSLIIAANLAPLIARSLFKERYSVPLDFEVKFFDNQPLLGPNKTWMGLFAAILLTASVAFILRFPLEYGIFVATAVMLGDAITSFIKRRLKVKPGESVIFLDQTLEIVFGFAALNFFVEIKPLFYILGILVFVPIDLIGSELYARFKHISIKPLIKGISRLGLLPNHITAMSVIFGLCAIILLILKHPFLGLFFVLLERAFDGLDGALARYIKRKNKFGNLLDKVTDRILITAYFFAAYLGGFLDLQKAVVFSVLWLSASILLVSWKK